VGHVFLLGDSIFDNAAYVKGEPSVIDHLRQGLPSGWEATMLAADGAIAADVHDQMRGLVQEATHVFLSAGGNDAYNASGILAEGVRTVAEATRLLAKVQARFRQDFQELVAELMAAGRPLTVCTVYDAIPGLDADQRCALGLFNDVIIRAAFDVHAAVIDLRLICNHAEDYSEVSPIEPSGSGGAKIARVIAEVATQTQSSSGGCRVYW